MSNSSNQLEEAFQILSRYERSLMQKMAAEIVESKEDFESPFVGGCRATHRQILPPPFLSLPHSFRTLRLFTKGSGAPCGKGRQTFGQG